MKLKRNEKLEEKPLEKNSDYIGTEKICPIMSRNIHTESIIMHCRDDCEWHDGEGCGIWRIVKAIEKVAEVITT